MGSASAKEVYGAIAKAVSDFIADKMDLPPARVSADTAQERLVRHGAAQETVGAVAAFFAECDRARFSAEGAQGAAASVVLDKAKELLRRLEDVL